MFTKKTHCKLSDACTFGKFDFLNFTMGEQYKTWETLLAREVHKFIRYIPLLMYSMLQNSILHQHRIPCSTLTLPLSLLYQRD